MSAAQRPHTKLTRSEHDHLGAGEIAGESGVSQLDRSMRERRRASGDGCLAAGSTPSGDCRLEQAGQGLPTRALVQRPLHGAPNLPEDLGLAGHR